MGVSVLTKDDLLDNIEFTSNDYQTELDIEKRKIVSQKLNPVLDSAVESAADNVLLTQEDLLDNVDANVSGQSRNRLIEPTFQKTPGEEYNLLESAVYGVGNFPASAANLVGEVGVAATNPKNTFSALIDVATGFAFDQLPEKFVQNRDMAFKKEGANYLKKSDIYLEQANKFELEGNKSAAKRYREFSRQSLTDAGTLTDKVLRSTTSSSALKEFYKERYGSYDGFKKAFAEDSAGVLADVLAVVKAGKFAAIASKVPTASKSVFGPPEQFNPIAKVLDKVESAIEAPFVKTGQGIAWAGKKALTGAATGLDKLGPGVGIESLGQAFKSGFNNQTAFIKNMTNPELYGKGLVDKVKVEFNKLKQERGNAYKERMRQLKQGDEVISFKPLDDLMDSIRNEAIQYKTNKPNKPQLIRWQEIKDKIQEYKKNGLNKAEDFDQLKKDINAINDDIAFGTEESAIFSPIQAKVRESITIDSPIYNKMMNEYMDASVYLDELNADFSLNKGRTGKSDTALRKLQSIFRNNANTNYGARIGNIQEILNRNPDIAPGLAGMNMSADFPRGIEGLRTGLSATGGGLLGQFANLDLSVLAPAIAAYLSTQSPKLVGNVLYGAGRGLSKTDDLLGNLPSKAGRIGGTIADNAVSRGNIAFGPLSENLNNPDDKFNLIPQAIINYNKSKGLI